MEIKNIQVGKINNREEFISFLEVFYSDYQKNGENWENNDLGRFLEALLAWTKDADGYYKNNNIKINTNNASWRVFADILMGARIYE